MVEPGAEEAYESARLAFELGVAVRELRLARGWSQAELASAAGMTQSRWRGSRREGLCRPCRCWGGSREHWTRI
ncbi:MAG: helix-turn-helix domain-containing protein [Pseudonocardiaceae bacterium]